jgi:hypothetical protein
MAIRLGALVDVGVSRPLRNAPVLGKVIAVIGVAFYSAMRRLSTASGGSTKWLYF